MNLDIKEIYSDILELASVELKGKNMLYTSSNGHMFSQLNKALEVGIRFSEQRKKELIQELNTSDFKSYGATMKGYVKIPNELLLNKQELVVKLLLESQDYVNSLPSK